MGKSRELSDVNSSMYRKNLLINGAMQVWQRGTSSGAGGYLADRFHMSIYSGSVNSSREISGLSEFYFAYRLSNNTGVCELEQRIEGTDIPSGVNEITLSFWIRGNKTGTVRSGRIINGNTGVTNTGYGYVDVSTSWQRISVTTTNQPPTSPAQYYRLFVLDDIANYLSSSSDWLEITGVQLELGSVATDFEHRSYGEELSLCQRYFQRHDYTTLPYSLIGATNYSHHIYSWTYPTMRATPSFTHVSGTLRIYSTNSGYAVSTHAGVNTGIQGMRLYVDKVAGNNEETWWDAGNPAYSYVCHLDAEL
jgi:hypothetical protein